MGANFRKIKGGFVQFWLNQCKIIKWRQRGRLKIRVLIKDTFKSSHTHWVSLITTEKVSRGIGGAGDCDDCGGVDGAGSRDDEW